MSVCVADQRRRRRRRRSRFQAARKLAAFDLLIAQQCAASAIVVGFGTCGAANWLERRYAPLRRARERKREKLKNSRSQLLAAAITRSFRASRNCSLSPEGETEAAACAAAAAPCTCCTVCIMSGRQSSGAGTGGTSHALRRKGQLAAQRRSPSSGLLLLLQRFGEPKKKEVCRRRRDTRAPLDTRLPVRVLRRTAGFVCGSSPQPPAHTQRRPARTPFALINAPPLRRRQVIG